MTRSAKKNETRPARVSTRKLFYTAKIDWNTLDVYIRLTKKRQSTADKYAVDPSPQGNIYAATESELIDAVESLFKAHIRKAQAFVKHIQAPSIPAVYHENKTDGRTVTLKDDDELDNVVSIRKGR